eukprot:349837-Chlamydomonas_euryale.AAC.1
MDMYRTFVSPISLNGYETWTCTEVQMGRLEVTHSNCLRRIVDVNLTDLHRLETIHEQCDTSSLELMVRRQTLSVDGALTEDGRVEQLKLRPGHRNIKTFLGHTALQSGGAKRKPDPSSAAERLGQSGLAGCYYKFCSVGIGLRSHNRLDI